MNTSNTVWRRKNPYPSTVLTNQLLSGEGSNKEIRHYEFDLGDSGITYSPGDGLGVVPLNDPSLVSAILTRLNISPDAEIPGRDGNIGTLMTEIMEISTPNSGLVIAVEKQANNEELSHIVATRDREALDAFLWSKDILDILNLNANITFTAEEFFKLLRPLMHRTYSISSSPKKYPDQIHATIATVRYHAHHREHGGVCSTFLADRIKQGEKVGIFMVPNKNFQLPEDDSTPIIMIGPGTGVAPFLAFLQEREARGAKGKNWLFFGDQHRTTDYIYKKDLEALMEKGLTRLDLAFSRDQNEKLYVQHRLKQHEKEIYKWIEEGANIYVCGDATRMAPDVDETLREILIQNGNMSEDKAIDFLEDMQLQKRYLRDIY